MNCKSFNQIHTNLFNQIFNISYRFQKKKSHQKIYLNSNALINSLKILNFSFVLLLPVSFWGKIVWIKCCKLLLLITRESKKKPQRIPKTEICVWRKIKQDGKSYFLKYIIFVKKTYTTHNFVGFFS